MDDHVSPSHGRFHVLRVSEVSLDQSHFVGGNKVEEKNSRKSVGILQGFGAPGMAGSQLLEEKPEPAVLSKNTSCFHLMDTNGGRAQEPLEWKKGRSKMGDNYADQQPK